MFDFVAEPLAAMLAFFYALIPNYAVAIFLLTVVIMLVLTPLTLKSTRSMTAMQELQPEIKALQAKHRGDRQKLNEEMLKLYQERGVNPLGGCLPLLVQLPFFFAIFTVIRGLTSVGPDGTFEPKYVSPDTQLYKSLVGQTEMVSFGIDLAESANEVLQESFVDALPYILLVGLTALFAWLQQRQLARRRRDSGAPALPAQQQFIMKWLPYVGVVFAFFFPAGLVIYWVTSSLWRIGQQAYINRTITVKPASAVVDVSEAAPSDVPGDEAKPPPVPGDGDAPAPRTKAPRGKAAGGTPPAAAPRQPSSRAGGTPARRSPPGRRSDTGTGGSNGARRSSSRKGKTEDKGPSPSRRTGGPAPQARRRRKKR